MAADHHPGGARKGQALADAVATGGHATSELATSSRAVFLYVGLMAASFAACTAVLHAAVPVDAALWASFHASVPSEVFQWQLAGFGGVLALNAINLAFCASPVQFNCNMLLLLIHGVAFATDWLLAAGATSLVVSWGGSVFVPLRYVQWAHTTPTMVLLMGMTSDVGGAAVTRAVAADLVMIATGLVASWTSGVVQLAALSASFAAFAAVLAFIVEVFRSAIDEADAEAAGGGGGGDGLVARRLLGRMRGLTVVVWSLFPAVWAAAWMGAIGPSWEQALWGVSDYAAKVVFSSHLWQKNLATVAQRRAAAQELLGALDRGMLMERLRALLAARERLVYALSNELRAPLTGMLALVSELLHNKAQSSGARARMLMMLRSSATCLLSTIDATLSGAAGAAGAGGLSQAQLPGSGRAPHKVHLWRTTEQVLRLVRPMARGNVRLVNCISRDMPPVKGDGTRVMQALMSLVVTSLKGTAQGTIKVSASQTHNSARVVVADTGGGIPPEQLAAALNPLSEGVPAQRGTSGGGGATAGAGALGDLGRLGGGLGGGDDDAASSAPDLWAVCRGGLGLYLVRQALAAMGAELEATSEVGKGSSFAFELPLADEDCDSESEADTDLVLSEAGSARASLELAEAEATAWRVGGSGTATSSNRSSQPRSSIELFAPNGRLAGEAFVAPSPSAASSAAASAGAVVAAAAAGAAVGGGGGGGPAPAALRPNHRSVAGGQIQVLSVDDDPVNQMVAATALKAHRWQVVRAMSGAEALSYLEGTSLSSGGQTPSCLPDLVLLDVMMPSMSGYELAARIRQTYPSSVLPIIMVSAKTEEADVVQGLRCGADDYVAKPFKRAELAARIRAHIRARDAFAAQQAAEQEWAMAHNLLPLNVQRKLRAGETVIAEGHPAATVLWAEVVSAAPMIGPSSGGGGAVNVPLARLAASPNAPGGDGDEPEQDARTGELMSPAEAVVRLNALYTTWEELCAEQDVLGVDFSGSTFVAVSGHDDNPDHLGHIIRAAEAMMRVAAGTRQPDGSPLTVRLGVHTGPITTGLVGSKAVKLVLMGDTVEVARGLAAGGSADGAHVSAAVYDALPPEARAAAVPWTLQRLPGTAAPQRTYLLPHTGREAAVAEQRLQLQASRSATALNQLAAAASGADAPGADSGAAGAGAANERQQQDEDGEETLVMPRSSSRVAVATAVSSLATAGAPAAAQAASTASHSDGRLPVLAGERRDSSSSLLLAAELGTERRQLQARLLERTEAAAATAAELACARSQLAEAREALSARDSQLEALRGQLNNALVRAHLADCWRALAAMKGQMLSAQASSAGLSVSGGGGAAVAGASGPLLPQLYFNVAGSSSFPALPMPVGASPPPSASLPGLAGVGASVEASGPSTSQLQRQLEQLAAAAASQQQLLASLSQQQQPSVGGAGGD